MANNNAGLVGLVFFGGFPFNPLKVKLLAGDVRTPHLCEQLTQRLVYCQFGDDMGDQRKFPR